MRRAIVNLQSAIDTRRAYCSNVVCPVKATNVSRGGQSVEISPLKVQELVQSEKVILCNLQHHHLDSQFSLLRTSRAIQISSKIETLHVAEKKF